MVYRIAIAFFSVWLLGVITSYTFNGYIHILLAVALVVLIVRVVNGVSLT